MAFIQYDTMRLSLPLNHLVALSYIIIIFTFQIIRGEVIHCHNK